MWTLTVVICGIWSSTHCKSHEYAIPTEALCAAGQKAAIKDEKVTPFKVYAFCIRTKLEEAK